MKSRFYLSMAIVALSWMGCSQEEDAVNQMQMNGGKTINATIESITRSTVTDAGVFSWAEGDAISLHDATNFDVYNYSGSGNGFTLPDEASNAVTEPIVAYYPASESHTTTAFNLPEYYGSTDTEYVANTNAAMMATPPAEGGTYSFMHLGGVMRFIVKNVPAGTTEFKLTISDKNIFGSFNVIDNDGVKTIQTSDGDNSSVSVKFKALTEAKDMTFYIPLPTGNYTNYTVILTGNWGYVSYPSTDVNNTISRKTLLLMPTFTYDTTLGSGRLLKGKVSSDNVIDLTEGSAEAEIIGNADVQVTPGDDADAVANLNYTPAADGTSALSISDGSAEGAESGESGGKVVVSTSENATIASCDINTPKLTVELSAADGTKVTYNEVTALTAQQTLIIGEGVTVTNLTVKGGNVRVQGTVSTITRDGENTDEVIYVIYEEDQIPETTLGENIVAVSAAEYDLILAFANGGTVTLDADVTLHKPLTLSDGVTLNLNLNGKTLTGTFREACIKSSGNLTISNGYITTVGCAVLTEGGTLEMTDCKVTMTGGYWENAVEIRGRTTAEITGGQYTATGTLNADERTDWYGIAIVDGTVTLNTTVNGNFNGGVTLAPEGTRPNVTITGGSYSGKKYHGLNMNGGDLALNGEMEFNGSGGDIWVHTKTGTINGVVFDFTLEGQKSYTLDELVEIIGSITDETTVMTPEKLAAAIAAGGEVKLGVNITLNEPLNVSNDVILNLNGKTLTGTFREACIKSSGNLTISNGNITNVGCAVLTNGGTLKMTDCKVTMTGGYWENAVEIRGGTTAEITGGQYTATGTLNADERTDWYGIAIVDGTVTLNTTVDGNFNGGVTLAPEGTRPNVTIIGGSYSGQKYHGLNMNGGDLYLTNTDMAFYGNGGDICVYTKTGTINNDKSFGDSVSHIYTWEELKFILFTSPE